MFKRNILMALMGALSLSIGIAALFLASSVRADDQDFENGSYDAEWNDPLRSHGYDEIWNDPLHEASYDAPWNQIYCDSACERAYQERNGLDADYRR